MPITSSTKVSGHDLNMSTFWLLHQACLSGFLRQSAVKTWPCLSELECANRTQLGYKNLTYVYYTYTFHIYIHIYIHTYVFYIYITYVLCCHRRFFPSQYHDEKILSFLGG